MEPGFCSVQALAKGGFLEEGKKKELVASVLSEDQGGAKKLTKADIEELFSLD